MDRAIRKATLVIPTPATRDRVLQILADRKAEIESHFGLRLGEPEDPQFLRYVEGDYFVAHQDGNTPLVFDATRFRRSLSSSS